MEVYLTGLIMRIGPLFCVLLAAFLQSITGFGLVIVAAPLLMLFYDPKLVVPVMLLLACCGNCVQGFMYRKQANLRLIAWLYLGTLLGQPLGFMIYDAVSSDTLKLIISGMVIFSIGIMKLLHIVITERPRNAVITGALSGISSITTGMGGPPLLIYLARTKMSTDVLRATCFIYFFCINVTSLCSYEIGGYSLQPALHEWIYLLPALALGIIAGHLAYHKVPKAFVRKLIFVLLLATSFYTIAVVLYKNFMP